MVSRAWFDPTWESNNFFSPLFTWESNNCATVLHVSWCSIYVLLVWISFWSSFKKKYWIFEIGSLALCMLSMQSYVKSHSQFQVVRWSFVQFTLVPMCFLPFLNFNSNHWSRHTINSLCPFVVPSFNQRQCLVVGTSRWWHVPHKLFYFLHFGCNLWKFIVVLILLGLIWSYML